MTEALRSMETKRRITTGPYRCIAYAFSVLTAYKPVQAFTPEQATANWMKKVQTLGGKPYYAPMDLPGEAAGDE